MARQLLNHPQHGDYVADVEEGLVVAAVRPDEIDPNSGAPTFVERDEQGQETGRKAIAESGALSSGDKKLDATTTEWLNSEMQAGRLTRRAFPTEPPAKVASTPPAGGIPAVAATVAPGSRAPVPATRAATETATETETPRRSARKSTRRKANR
jgi:hypothetical protein